MGLPKRLDTLTSLRFFAAAAVVLSHYKNYLIGTGSEGLDWFALHVLGEGYIGVTFFFILSGFVIGYGYEAKVRSGETSARDFYAYRAARIVPLHWLTLLAMFPIYWTFLTDPRNGLETWYRLLSNTFLLQAAIPRQEFVFSFNAVSWSISVELFFYLAFPVLAGLRTRWLAFALAAVLAAQLAALGLVAWPDAKVSHYVFYVNPAFRSADFIAGLLLARLFIARRETLPRGTLAEFGCVAALVVWVAVGIAIVPQNFRWDIYYMAPMAALIVVFAGSKGALSAALGGRALILLGASSFSLYMIHQLIMVNLDAYTVIEEVSSPMHGTLIMIGLGAVAVGLSVLCYRWFEEPLNRRLRGLLVADDHLTGIECVGSVYARKPDPIQSSRK